nr:arf-GAP with coiled-coil, ANK repeat and PH domain-containing protein 1-like [Anser cygnoides]
MADALAHGADPGWVNAAEENRTPLLQAVAANSLLACEFLLQNGASVNQSDSHGRGPLHHATMLGHTGCVPVTNWEGNWGGSRGVLLSTAIA